MALFVLASKDGWVSIMYTGLDAVGIDQQVCWHTIVYLFNRSVTFSQAFYSLQYTKNTSFWYG